MQRYGFPYGNANFQPLLTLLCNIWAQKREVAWGGVGLFGGGEAAAEAQRAICAHIVHILWLGDYPLLACVRTRKKFYYYYYYYYYIMCAVRCALAVSLGVSLAVSLAVP